MIWWSFVFYYFIYFGFYCICMLWLLIFIFFVFCFFVISFIMLSSCFGISFYLLCRLVCVIFLWFNFCHLYVLLYLFTSYSLGSVVFVCFGSSSFHVLWSLKFHTLLHAISLHVLISFPFCELDATWLSLSSSGGVGCGGFGLASVVGISHGFVKEFPHSPPPPQHSTPWWTFLPW